MLYFLNKKLKLSKKNKFLTHKLILLITKFIYKRIENKKNTKSKYSYLETKKIISFKSNNSLKKMNYKN